MTSIGVYEAKTQLARLLDRVSRGERFVITKHGRPVAELIPATASPKKDVKKVIEAMLRWQKEHGPTLGPKLTIRQLREEGRR